MTLFERILNNELPVVSVYEDKHVLAFNDINPQAPVHVLVIPKQKATALHDFIDDTQNAGHFMQSLAKVIAELNLSEGYRVVCNSGSDGGQTVHYLHAHILGGRQMNWPPG